MVQTCCVPGCGSCDEERGSLFKFYRFPRDKVIARQWQEKIRLKSYTDKSRVCSLHFHETSYMLTNLGWNVLLPDAIPSESLPDLEIKQEVDDGDEIICIKIKTEECDATGTGLSQMTNPYNNTETVITESIFNKEMQSLLRGQVSHPRSEYIPMPIPKSKEATEWEQFQVGVLLSGEDGKRQRKLVGEEVMVSELLGEGPYSSTQETTEHTNEEEVCSSLPFGRKNVIFPSFAPHKNVSKVKPWPCRWCEESFSKMLHFREHCKSHKEKAFVCPVCKMCYFRFGAFTQHMKSQHKPVEMPLTCQECFFTFQNQKSLSNHVPVHARKNYAHQCPICSRKFFSATVLKRHRLIHTLQGSGDADCPYCKETFQSRVKLLGHMRSKHVNRLFLCDSCDHFFPTKHQLKAHQAAHKIVFSKYSCGNCLLKCGSLQELQKHKEFNEKCDQYYCNATPDDFLEAGFLELQLPVKMEIEVNPCEGISDNDEELNPCEGISDNEELTPCEGNSDNEELNPCEGISDNEELNPCEGISDNEELTPCEGISDNHEELRCSENAYTNSDSNEFKCIECGEQCGSDVGLAEHYEKHVKEEPEDCWSSDEEQ